MNGLKGAGVCAAGVRVSWGEERHVCLNHGLRTARWAVSERLASDASVSARCGGGFCSQRCCNAGDRLLSCAYFSG